MASRSHNRCTKPQSSDHSSHIPSFRPFPHVAEHGRGVRVALLTLLRSLRSQDYKSHFPNRNLQAFSTQPLLVQPCHYAGDPQWVSDTETSTLWDDDSVRTDWRGSRKSRKGSAPQADVLSGSYRDEL